MGCVWLVVICAGLGAGEAQRATAHSAAVIINAIIDQIDQEWRMKGGDEFGPSV